MHLRVTTLYIKFLAGSSLNSLSAPSLSELCHSRGMIWRFLPSEGKINYSGPLDTVEIYHTEHLSNLPNFFPSDALFPSLPSVQFFTVPRERLSQIFMHSFEPQFRESNLTKPALWSWSLSRLEVISRNNWTSSPRRFKLAALPLRLSTTLPPLPPLLPPSPPPPHLFLSLPPNSGQILCKIEAWKISSVWSKSSANHFHVRAWHSCSDLPVPWWWERVIQSVEVPDSPKQPWAHTIR